MKKQNRSKTLRLIILSAMVVTIWSIVIVRIFRGIDDGANKENQISSSLKDMVNTDSISDYTLYLNYRDPFLKRSTNSKPATNSKSPRQTALPKPIVRKKPKTDPFPKLKYLGQVDGSNSQQQVIILSVGGKNCFLSENDQVGDLKVLAITSDSIIIGFGELTKSILK